MQQTSKTHETYCCNIYSSTSAPLPLWTLVDADLDAGTELDATAWRSDLGCEPQTMQGESSARREARDAGEAREAQGARGVRHGGRWVRTSSRTDAR
jgi:hypothetical protein